MTDRDSKIDSQLIIVKNMDDWVLYARDMNENEEKLEKFLQFAAKKT